MTTPKKGRPRMDKAVTDAVIAQFEAGKTPGELFHSQLFKVGQAWLYEQYRTWQATRQAQQGGQA